MLYRGIKLTGVPDLDNVRRLDLLTIPAVMEMQQYGMSIDVPYLEQLTEELTAELKELRYQICSHVPASLLDEFIEKANLNDEDEDQTGLPLNVDSNDQLAKLMFDTLCIGDGHKMALTKSGHRKSTGKKQLEKLKHQHPVVPKVLMYKERAKLKSTYTVPFPKAARLHSASLRGQVCWCGLRHWAETQRIHTQLSGTGTNTGRFSSKKPNLQNISTRTELGRRVRKAFVATPGTVMVGCDFSQIEMRLGAHYSQDANLLRIFHEGLDPHTDTARRAFKTETPDKLTQRDPCKNVNFGVFYGLSGPGLYDLMAVTYATAGIDLPDWLTVDWCEDFITQWFGLYPGVAGYIEAQHHRARRYGLVWTLFGRIRRVPETRSVHNRVVSAGLRQGGNAPIQGTCADLMRLAIAKVRDQVVLPMRLDGIWCRLLITVHDELILEVEEAYGELARDMMQAVFEDIMRDEETHEQMLAVPVKADAKTMVRWSK